MPDWIAAAATSLVMVVATAVGMYVALIVMTRLAGVRSYSKMSGFDLAVTVSIGSVMAALFSLQMGVAALRVRFDAVEGSTNNTPRLIMGNGRVLHDQMVKARVTESDLLSKLREANMQTFAQVDAVVAETTGDLSVLHGAQNATPLSRQLLEGVIDADRYEPGGNGD